jgi:phosphoesterase RecJ-like protein
MTEAVQELINRYERITVLTHLNPDADTIGTALGIYGILKKMGKQVEIANQGLNIPRHLDFLPNFSKLKKQMDYNDSLIVACDTGSIDRLGFDLSGREILNIDHHKSNTNFGTVNVINPLAVSASQVAYELFKNESVINKEVATCFYTALVADTQYFSSNNVSRETFKLASEMMSHGVDIYEVMSNIKQRRSLSSIRILASSLDTLLLNENGRLSIMCATREKMLEAGADIIDTVGIVDYGISLVTVQIAVVLTELENSIRISMRSKSIDVSQLAIGFGGGGHKNAAGFELENISKDVLLEMIKKEIKKLGLLDA